MGIAYTLGRAVGRNKAAAAAVALVVLAGVGWQITADKAPAAAPAGGAVALAPRVSASQAAEAARVRRCTEQLGEVMAAARASLAKGNPEGAYQALLPCRAGMTDPAARTLFDQVTAAADKQSKAREAAAHTKDLAERKKQGVSIGMTQQQVIESSWGRPEKINRTTRAGGVTEQWVYGGGGYLYFTDGVLRTIQN